MKVPLKSAQPFQILVSTNCQPIIKKIAPVYVSSIYIYCLNQTLWRNSKNRACRCAEYGFRCGGMLTTAEVFLVCVLRPYTTKYTPTNMHNLVYVYSSCYNFRLFRNLFYFYLATCFIIDCFVYF